MLAAELDLCKNHLSFSMIEVMRMHKKDVPGVDRAEPYTMEHVYCTGNDFGVCIVSGHISGKHHITVLHAVSTGLGSGLSRTAPSGAYANSLATAPANYTPSRITGLSKYRRSELTTVRFGTWSTMQPIFIRTVVC